MQKKNREAHHYEFAGPYLGPIGMMIGLPILTFLYARFCNDQGWPIKGLTFSDLTPAKLFEEFVNSWSTEVFLIYVGYWFFQALLYFILPGEKMKGVKLSDGSQLTYPINGLLSSAVTLSCILAIHLF
jgi:hypothetical protein